MVENIKRQVQFDIEDVEQANVVALLPVNVTEATNEKQTQTIETSQVKIMNLNETKTELESRMNTAESASEKAKIQAQLDKTDNKIAQEQVEILSTTKVNY